MTMPEDRLTQYDRIELGCFPTPIREVEIGNGSIWVKDDGVCSELYGGNKVRKLEWLLADARKRNVRRLVVHGDTGSHNVMACSLYGKRCGFDVSSVVYSYREDDDARRAVPQLLNAGISVIRTKNLLSNMFRAHWLGLKRGSYLIPLGCSTPVTTLGYVMAALELCQQIEEGQLPMPDKIYIAHATGGSVAGLLVGFAMRQVPIKVVAVQTVEKVIAGYRPLKRLVGRTLDLLDLRRELFERSMQGLDRIDDRFLGTGYRDFSKASLGAVQQMGTADLHLEPVFTGKAMAALLADMNSKECLLFWNTHDQPVSLS